MVVAKALRAKMDRPAGIVSVRGRQGGRARGAWTRGARGSRASSSSSRPSCHQIHKESMVHKVLRES